MRITIEDFKKLTTEEQEFVITHGADNCQLVKFSPGIADILYDYFGESTYDSENVVVEEMTEEEMNRIFG